MGVNNSEGNAIFHSTRLSRFASISLFSVAQPPLYTWLLKMLKRMLDNRRGGGGDGDGVRDASDGLRHNVFKALPILSLKALCNFLPFHSEVVK